MAKRVIPDYFIFTPSTNTIVIPNRVISPEHFLLITNVSSNTVMYNFSDPDLRATITAPFSSTGTRIVLNYSTASMSSSDPLSILVDEDSQEIIPAEILQDPTNKLRVAAPQSLIDTDFEYGLQPIKWESLVSAQNIPCYYFRSGGNSLPVADITGGNQTPRSTMTVTTSFAHGLVTGDLVSVAYSNSVFADGAFPVLTVPTATSFTYTAKGQVNGTVLSSSIAIQGGSIFDSDNNPSRIIFSTITSDNAAGAGTGSTITVNTTGKHGLLPGTPILVNSSGTTSANGVWTVYDVPTPTSFRFQTPGFSTQTSTVTNVGTVVMVRPEGNFVHRPSDGGVLITASNVQVGVTAIRQSRRYFRYQSGKGVQMSTGTKFTPSYDINTITSAGTTCTITTQQIPNIGSGATIVVEGVEVNAGANNPYNGTFTVTAVNSISRTITFTMAGTSTDTSPGGRPVATVRNWRGSAVRVGFFDAQNGFYYEYDGTTLFAVRRNSTKELMGTVTATSGSTTITGSQTKFSKQLTAGDYVVIRGQSYLVIQIDSDTSMDVAPAYRGPTVSGVRVNLTQNIRTPQSQWNLDRCDGTGPTGYNIDMTKMQMSYIDYTWYGAGFVRFGWRMTDGNVVYCHKVANNNVNNQAYMRSGNLPTRYEVTNIGPYTRLVSGNQTSAGVTLQASDTQMVVADATYWPTTGTFVIQQNTSVEVIAYTGKVQNTSITINGANTWLLTGLSRRQLGGTTSNMTFIPTEFEGGTAGFSSQASLCYITCDCAPTIMHWGTSVIMDGGFNDDRSIQFAYTKQAQVTVNANTSIAVLSIRLAPSVDNSIAGQFGAREIVNRMQLQIRSMGLVTTTSVQVLGVLNANFPASATQPTFPGVWTTTSIVNTIGSGSLAQIIDHTSNTTIVSGGEQIFGFVTANTGDTFDLGQVRDLGTSIISGNGSARTPGYPNGPDILTIVIRNTNAAAATINNLRLSWTEAQA